MTTATIQTDSDFFAEILEDYYAECDEHLTAVRENLLSLESGIGQKKADYALVDDLFRRFHSLKGMSGMVGYEEVAEVAHHLESYLRLLRKEQVTLTAKAYDGLLVGARALEISLVARRQQQQPQNNDSVIALLETMGSAREAASAPGPAADPMALSENVREQLTAAVAAGQRIWQFEFEPSPELAAKGVNVNFIREQFASIGQLIHGAPNVTDTGGISFLFLVASKFTEGQVAEWAGSYLTYQPYETAVSAPPETIHDNGRAPIPETAIATPQTNYVRVDLNRLDDLMQMVGELVIHRARLEDRLDGLRAILPKNQWRALKEINQAIERDLRDLREGVMRTRMVPIGETFARMKFVVRDLVRQSGKQARLEISGQNTEIDKLVVEKMMDPLLHIVRNAISHGLQLPETRQAQGKPAQGTIWLRAKTEGDVVIIQIEDDGQGINADKVAQRGREAGLLLDNEPVTPERILDIICAPGLSTKDEADMAAGRGVGMNVVRQTVEQLGGVMRLDYRPGQGTCFTIELPLTLAIADALIVTVSGQRFAIPQAAVREVLEVDETAVTRFENNEILRHRDAVVPLLRLNRAFCLPPANGRAFALIIGNGLQTAGLVVDRILGLREIVVRAITDPLIRVPGISGATELGDGRAVLILDGAELVVMRNGKRET